MSTRDIYAELNLLNEQMKILNLYLRDIRDLLVKLVEFETDKQSIRRRF